MAQKDQTAADAAKDPSAKTRAVHVDVYAFEEDGDVLFAQAWKRDGDTKRKMGHITIDEGEGDVPIRFKLYDRTKLDLAFLAVDSSNQGGPFWCNTEDCPTAWGNCDGQITSIENLPNGGLQVVDANTGDPCTLHYALRFSAGTVAPTIYEFDPDIRNGGGSTGGGGSS